MQKSSLLELEWQRMQSIPRAIVEMPRYFKTNASAQDLNSAAWSDFLTAMNVLAVSRLKDTDLEFALVKKNYQWSCEDISLFVGGDKDIFTLDDFTQEEGRAFFKQNFYLADSLLADTRRPVQISWGFNHEDLSPGHHSLLRLHTHIRRINHPLDKQHVKANTNEVFDGEDLLNFIEPFSPVYKDVLEGFLSQSDITLSTPLQYDNGLIRFSVPRKNNGSFFVGLQRTTEALRTEYENIEKILCARQTLGGKTKFKLHSLGERKSNLKEYFTSTHIGYSQESKRLLEYLVANVGTDQNNTRLVLHDGSLELNITRGFAAGFNFTLSPGSDDVMIEYFPRVITKSGPSKTMLGLDSPIAGFIKKDTASSAEERLVSQTYHKKLIELLEAQGLELFPVFNCVSQNFSHYKERALVHRQGDWHRGIQANIIRRNKAGTFDVLVQHRSKAVDIGKDQYDQSLAVQMLSVDNLSTMKSLRRGLVSELGIDIDKDVKGFVRVPLAGWIVKRYAKQPGMFNNELLTLYLVEVGSNHNVEARSPKVKNLFWMEWSEFIKFFENNASSFTKTSQYYFSNKTILNITKEYSEALISSPRVIPAENELEDRRFININSLTDTRLLEVESTKELSYLERL